MPFTHFCQRLNKLALSTIALFVKLALLTYSTDSWDRLVIHTFRKISQKFEVKLWVKYLVI